MATGVTTRITIDGVDVSTTDTDPTEDMPICHGPITVYVDNGKQEGEIREKLATITVRLYGQKLLKTITVGSVLKLPISIDGEDEITLFDGMIYETSHSPINNELVDVTLTGKDDKTRIELFGETAQDWRPNAHWTGLPDPPGQLYSIDQLTQFQVPGSTPLVEYHRQDAAGNAWNDEYEPTVGRWPWALGVDGLGTDYTSTGMFNRIKRSGQIALLRYGIESGIGAYQAARYYGSTPYEIPADYIVSDQAFEAELFSRVNRQNLGLEYDHRLSGSTTSPYVNPDNEEEQERFGVIEESTTYEGLWALDTDEFETDYPLSWEHRRRLTSPHNHKRPWYSLDGSQVLLHKMIGDTNIGPAVVSDMLENIYDLHRRIGDDPYIPSVAITGAAMPMPDLELGGVVEAAELVITPRHHRPPRLDMAISLGPGDGYASPYNTAPRPLIWAEAHYSWFDTKIAWKNAD